MLNKLLQSFKTKNSRQIVIFIAIVFVILIVVLPSSFLWAGFHDTPLPSAKIYAGQEDYLFENKNPNFSIGFGESSDPEKHLVSYSMRPLNINPLSNQSNSANVFQKVKEAYFGTEMKDFKFGLKEVGISKSGNQTNKEFVDSLVNRLAISEQLVKKLTQVKSKTETKFELKTNDEGVDYVVNPDVLEGIDLKYRVLENQGLKEEIIIHSTDQMSGECRDQLRDDSADADEACSLPKNEFVFSYELGASLSLKQSQELSELSGKPIWYIEDEFGRYLSHFESLYAVDAIGAKTTNLDFIVEKENQISGQIRVVLDYSWMLDESRVFPIIIDPTLVHDTQVDFSNGHFNRTEVTTDPKVKLAYQELLADSATVGLWHMNETSAGTCTGGLDVCDSSGTGNHCNAVNSSFEISTKLLGTAAHEFNGSSSYVDCGSSSSLDDLEDMTIETWIYPQSDGEGNYGRIASKRGSGNGWQLWTENETAGTVDIRYIEDYTTTDFGLGDAQEGNITTGEWHHVAVVKDSDFAKMYVDGQLVDQSTAAGTKISNAPETFQIGSIIHDWSFDGFIDEFRVSNVARTAEEIKISASYRPYGTYTSPVIDVGSGFSTINWDEYEVGPSAAGDIQFQTRTGADNSPNDGDWEEWRPITGESQIDSMDRQYLYSGESNLVGYWPMDEEAGSVVGDQSGNGNNATANGTTIVDGKYGESRDFTRGSSDYVEVADLSYTKTLPYSVSVWFEADDLTNNSPLVNKYAGGSWNGFNLFIYSNKLCSWHIRNSSNYTAIAQDNGVGSTACYSISANNLYNATITVDSSGIKMYINGNLVRSSNWVGSSGNSTETTPLRFGKYEGNYYDGMIDEVMIFDTALSETEINDIWKKGSSNSSVLKTSFDNTLKKEGLGAQNVIFLTDALQESFFIPTATQDLSSSSLFSFWTASDKPGTFIDTVVGESDFVNYIPDENTLGYWKLEESGDSTDAGYIKNSAQDVYDGQLGAGSLANAPDSVKGKFGNARHFNGSSDYMTMGDVSLAGSQFTIEGWFKFDSVGSYQALIDKEEGGVDWPEYGMLLLANNTVSARFSSTNSSDNYYHVETTETIEVNRWYHLAATLDASSDLRIYINGVEKAYLNASGFPYNNNDDLFIGAYKKNSSPYYGWNFDGTMDEVRISTIARSAEELMQTYEIGKRTHSVTYEFAAVLDSSNLITAVDDYDFVIDETAFGASEKCENLHPGDLVIIKENISGTDYFSQGCVTNVNYGGTDGRTLVASWDHFPSFPSGGYTAGASAFKWQQEFFDLSQIQDSHINEVDEFIFRVNNSHEERNVWIDDVRKVSSYLTDPSAINNIASSDNQYTQYRAIFTSSSLEFTPWFTLTEVIMDTTPDTDLLMRHGNYFSGESEKDFWWVNN
jgi:hypothetical protein